MSKNNNNNNNLISTDHLKYFQTHEVCFFAHFTERPKPVARVHPDRRVFRGETVTLTCDIQHTGDWQYSWNKDNKQDYIIGRDQNYIITPVDWSHRGVYSCKGTQSKAPTHSQMSDGVTLTVSGESVHFSLHHFKTNRLSR